MPGTALLCIAALFAICAAAAHELGEKPLTFKRKKS